MRFMLLFVFALFPNLLDAQFVREQHIELQLPTMKSQFGLLPLGEKGLVIYTEVVNMESVSNRKWEINYLDTDLELKWTSVFDTDVNFRITHAKYYNEYVYLLFQDMNIPMKSIFIARNNILKSEIELFEISEFLPKEFIGFEILGNSLFLIGIDSGRPLVMKFHFGDPRPVVLKGLYSENSELLRTSVLQDQQLIQIVTRMKPKYNSTGDLLVKQFEESGKVRREFLIKSSKGYDLIDAIAQTDSLGNTCVVGTFSYNKSKQSNGIFTMVVDAGGEHPLYYYDYTNLHNFFNYLTPDEKEKVSKKIEKDIKNKKKPNYKVNHELRDLSKSAEGWIYVGEIVNLTDRNYMTRNNLWSVEYRKYTHAIALGINVDGKLKWDNSIDMHGLESTTKRQQVYSNPSEDEVLLYYLDGHTISYKPIDGGKDLADQKLFPIDSQSQQVSNTNMESLGSILPWYRDKFITFGSHRLKAQEGETNYFFFLDKMSISPNLKSVDP